MQLLVHWRGGDHTQLHFDKVRVGQHRFIIPVNIIDLVRGLARLQPHGMIASILNRNSHGTAHEERWTARSVCALRNRHAIAVYAAGEWRQRAEVSVEEAAAMLKVSETAILKWIRSGRLHATQLCPHAPWVLRQSDVEGIQAMLAHATSSYAANADQPALHIQ